jgi:hypothetical protein
LCHLEAKTDVGHRLSLQCGNGKPTGNHVDPV